MYVKITIHSVLFFLFFLLLGHTISGFLQRSYTVAKEDAELILKGQKLTPQELAHTYQPKILIPKEKTSSKLEEAFFEVVEQSDRFSIIYYSAWKDEDLPNTALDLVYKFFRFFYYGFTLRDIEYVQIDVAKLSGDIVKVLFESPNPQSQFSDWKQEHLQTSIINKNDGFELTTLRDSTTLATKELSTLNFPLSLEVASWNHLFRLPTTSETRELDYSLTYLSDETYKRQKFARRGHGDFFTPESKMNTPIIVFAGLLATAYFFSIRRDYALRKLNAG